MNNNEAALAAAGGVAVVAYIICIALCVLVIIAEWKLFVKAGEPGWKILIPVYDFCIYSKIATGSMTKWLLCLIPVFGEVYAFILLYKFVKSFGKGGGFYVGTLFFPEIFIPIMAFSADTKYVGPQ